MSKVITVVNGKVLTPEEAEAYFADRPSLDEMLATEEGRKGLANAMTRASNMYGDGGLEHGTCGVTRGQVQDHREYIRQKGLAGVTVLPSGRIQFAGPRNKEIYLAARNMGELDGGSVAGPSPVAQVGSKKITRQKEPKSATGSSNTRRRRKQGRGG